MLNSYEFNYTLMNKLYKKERDILLMNRLKSIKSTLNTNCPNSFNIARKKPTKSNLKKDISNKIYIIFL